MGMERHFGIGLLVYDDIIDWDNYEQKIDPVIKEDVEFNGVTKKVYDVLIVPVDRPYVGVVLPSLWGKLYSTEKGGHQINLDEVDPRSIGVSVYAQMKVNEILNKMSNRKILLTELQLRFYDYYI